MVFYIQGSWNKDATHEFAQGDGMPRAVKDSSESWNMAKCYKWFSQISDYTERATKTSL
jgi:hypothetical protein